jgi:hypothetical protein
MNLIIFVVFIILYLLGPPRRAGVLNSLCAPGVPPIKTEVDSLKSRNVLLKSGWRLDGYRMSASFVEEMLRPQRMIATF